MTITRDIGDCAAGGSEAVPGVAVVVTGSLSPLSSNTFYLISPLAFRGCPSTSNATTSRARDDIRMVQLREHMLHAIQGAVELWSTDAGVSEALSDLFKSITALSVDATLLSLPPAPLLELVCGAAQRQLTAVWLALATMLIIQLNPTSLTAPLRVVSSQEVLAIVRGVVNVLLQATLTALSVEGAMEAVRQHPLECVRIVKDDRLRLFRIQISCRTSSISWRRLVVLSALLL